MEMIMIWLQCMRTTKNAPFLFSHFKERLKFKRIVKAQAKENQIRTFYTGYCNCCEAIRLRNRLIQVAYVST